MSSHSVEEIKGRLDIVDFIQSYVRLEKAGINFRARCPFHQERTPSFFVSPTRQTWRCFGCQKGGDVFSFTQEIEGVDFPEALKMLAERAGVKLVSENPQAVSERAKLLAVCEEAAKFFESNLRQSENANRHSAPMRYLIGRGLNEATISDFRIGYAPDSWDALYSHLSQKGFKEGEMEKAGLIIKKQESGIRNQEGQDLNPLLHNSRLAIRKYYDRYRNRIIFPIADSSGRIIAFGGRIFENGDNASEVKNGERGEAAVMAKYINSPETPLYNKSRVLYGFHKAKNAIRQKNECVLVEGYMDAVMSHQAGAVNTIAVSGTALTEEQLKIITRLASSVIFAFDMDAAGQNATKRSLDMAASANIERKVMLLPSGKDPADAVKENPALLLDAIKNAKPVMEYYFASAGGRFDIKNPQDKKNAALFFLPHVKSLVNEIERAHWIQKFSELISVPEAAIRLELEKLRFGNFSKEISASRTMAASSRRALLEEKLICLRVENPEIFADAEKNFPEPMPFAVLANERLYGELRAKKNISSQESQDLLEKLRFEREAMNYAAFNIAEEAMLVARGILKEHYKEKMLSLHEQIKNLEKTQNQDKMKNLLRDFNETAGKVKLYS